VQLHSVADAQRTAPESACDNRAETAEREATIDRQAREAIIVSAGDALGE
jgi:hypothetical protein